MISSPISSPIRGAQTAVLGQGAGGAAVPFDPVQLFGASEAGFIFDFSDLATMFTERTGASATTPTPVDGAIGTLKDLSPNASYFTASSAGASPTLRQTSTYYNAQFDGGDCLSIASASLYAAGAASIFAVVNAAAQSAANFIVGEGSSSSNAPLYGLTSAQGTGMLGELSSYYRTDASTLVLQPDSRPYGASFDSTSHVVGMVDTGTEVRMYVDGEMTGIRMYTRAATTPNRLALGALLRAALSNFFTGRMYAVVAIGRALTDAELGDLIPWLGAKAGLTSALASREIGPGAWTWYNDPRAIKVGSELVLGAQIQTGQTVVNRFNTSGVYQGRTVLTGTVQQDDHNNPALLLRASDGKLMAWYSAHNASEAYYQAISTNSGDASAFATPTNLDSQLGKTIYSYSNSYQLTGEANDPIYLFYRAGGPNLSTSTDDGATLSTGVQFITGANSDRVYVKFAQNGDDRIDCLLTSGNPSETVNCTIYHAYYQGGTWHGTDGTVLGSTFDFTAATLVWDGSTVDGEGWNWDIQIDGSGNPHCLIAVFPSNTDHRYRYAKWNGSAWVTYQICTAGTYLYASQPYYSGGVSFDPNDVTVVYASRDTGDGVHQLWRYTTADAGVNWSGTQLTSGKMRRIRPYVVRGQTAEPRLAYVEGFYPDYTNLSELWVRIGSST